MNVIQRIGQEIKTVRGELSNEISTINNAISGINTDIGNISNTPLNVSATIKGSFSLSNTIKTLIFDGFLYTGNGTTLSIITGMESIDFTVASNGNGYWHDRTAGDCIIKTDAGTIVTSGSLKLVKPISKVHIKGRSVAYNNWIFDGIRGVAKAIYTDLTNIENLNATTLTSFNNNGFSLGLNVNTNQNLATYIAYQTLYTHIKWGLTNQGKRYVEVYNPVTNESIGIRKYKINDIVPTSIGKADKIIQKNLSALSNWHGYAEIGSVTKDFILNTTAAFTNTGYYTLTDNSFSDSLGFAEDSTIYWEASCKSETWTNGIYGGNNGSKKIVTEDSNGVVRKPMIVNIKNIGGTGHWLVLDNKRGTNNFIYLSSSNNENFWIRNASIVDDGFIVNYSADGVNDYLNGTGSNYYYEVYFDTDVDGGGAESDLPTDTTQLQVANLVASISNGIDNNGAINDIVNFNGTIIPEGGWL